MSDTRLLVAQRAGFQTQYAADWATAKGLLQNVITKYGLLGFAALANIGDVVSLVNDPTTFVFIKQTGGGAKVIGTNGNDMPVNVEVAKTLILKPAGYPALAAAIDAFKAASTEGVGQANNNGSAFVRHFATTIAADFVYATGTLGFSTARQKVIDEAGNSYVTSAKGKAIAQFLADVTTSFTEHAVAMNVNFQFNDVIKTDEIVNRIFRPYLKSINTNTGVANLDFSNEDSVNPSFRGDQ